jgi:hypothetical protein
MLSAKRITEQETRCYTDNTFLEKLATLQCSAKSRRTGLAGTRSRSRSKKKKVGRMEADFERARQIYGAPVCPKKKANKLPCAGGTRKNAMARTCTKASRDGANSSSVFPTTSSRQPYDRWKRPSTEPKKLLWTQFDVDDFMESVSCYSLSPNGDRLKEMALSPTPSPRPSTCPNYYGGGEVQIQSNAREVMTCCPPFSSFGSFFFIYFH